MSNNQSNHSGESKDSNIRNFQQPQWKQQNFQEVEEAINDIQLLNIIKSIINEDPAILEYQNQERGHCTIFNTMMKNFLSLEIIKILVLKGPNNLIKQTSYHGVLPLHLVYKNDHCNGEIIKLLLNGYPDSVKIGSYGIYPLHEAPFGKVLVGVICCKKLRSEQ